MKPFHFFAFGLAVLAPQIAGCAAEEQEGAGAQFPTTPIGSDNVEQLVASPSAPGEAPIPIDTAPVASAASRPAHSGPLPPQEIVPGSTTEEEYEARAGDVNVGANNDEYADADPSALTDFRQTLDPYGSWVDDPNYGTVWTPSASVVGDGFAPYVSAGRWTYDDAQNWVWVSDYDWGWAPFHYGRWAYLGSRWGWIPGREYAGAWVTWRTGYGGWDNYLGWAPLPPSWGWRDGYAFGFGFTPQTPYVFCGANDVFNPALSPHLVSGGQVATVGAHTRVFASPTLAAPGGRVAAHPTVGPSPGSIGISPGQVARLPINNRGVMHAQQFARPATAQSLGAHAAMVSPRAYAQVSPRTGLSAPIYSSRNQAVATAPQYRGIAPTPYRYPTPYRGVSPAPYRGVTPAPYQFPSHSLGTIPNYGGQGNYGGRGNYGGQGSYGGAPHYGPTYSGGRYSAPSYGAPSYGGGGAAYGAYGAFRGAGGGGQVPSGSSGTSSSSTPYESPGPVHHGGGGGGGFRAGGGFRGGGGGHVGGGHR